MKAQPYKIISEIVIDPNNKSTGANIEVFYVCDGKQCENCYSDCYLTSNIHHAKRYGLYDNIPRTILRTD
jgi:hypothetical protein